MARFGVTLVPVNSRLNANASRPRDASTAISKPPQKADPLLPLALKRSKWSNRVPTENPCSSLIARHVRCSSAIRVIVSQRLFETFYFRSFKIRDLATMFPAHKRNEIMYHGILTTDEYFIAEYYIVIKSYQSCVHNNDILLVIQSSSDTKNVKLKYSL